ncbi:uncharacterized protein TM35_000391520 [Trypanosoma theileri]|uniref:Uncharacterized protein n=1 Tax=Trypanosoma theileri TaxID=67003 RepID=A0A1X0NKC9_9TRYP|nr:uncharacterized protein TM35_000391520 [Trypanosoma theileri]ORC84978.1 hypothetical protein TM35_000391520 [Trypanosoma theileri]
MRTSVCSVMHRFGPSFQTGGSLIKSLTSSCRHFRSCSNSGVLIVASLSAATAVQGGISKNSTHPTLLEARRHLFENRKKFPGVDHQPKKEQWQERAPHSDDAAVAARNSTLFTHVAGGDGRGMRAAPTPEALPSAAELDRVLPSLQQLRDEIPSATEAQRAMESDSGNNSIWGSNIAEKDDDEDE